jgi:hypothetical protein
MRAQAARYYTYSKSLLVGILLCALSFSFMTLIILGLAAMILVDRHFGVIVVAAVAAYVILRMIRALHGRSCRCQLCHGPVLVSRDCTKHRDARRYPLMSHRQSLLVDAALKGRFNCMYCGTPYRMWR